MLLGNHHLTYCTNIHPGEDWKSTFASLENYIPRVKKGVVPNNKFGVGLRLSNSASQELGRGQKLETFKRWLFENDSYVFTMNGFPFGDFHGQRVKDKVHSPDWTTQERFDYTERLFDQLDVLLPEGMDGGISTSPISYKHWHAGPIAVRRALEKGAYQMAKIALKLNQIERETGKYLHLDVEPEPDGLLENTDEVLYFYETFLVPSAITIFKGNGHGESRAEELAKRYITICYDICHFSLAFEEPENTFDRLSESGIQIGKFQISAALKILWNTVAQKSVWQELERFDEPTYLHQVTERGDGKIKTYPDLPLVLEKRDSFEELRAHFHVPIFLERFGLLESTQDQILKAFDCLKKNPNLTNHLEVETYTWEVLPKALKIPLTDSVVRELKWVKDRLQ